MAKINKNALPDGTILKHARTEYRIERYLGSGGFGITYLVNGTANVSGNTVTSKYCIKEHFLSSDCERDHQTLAVTCSKPAKQRVEDGKKDFISEAKRLRDKIQHSHIVRVKDVFEAFDTAYYVMEFLDGKSLRNYIKNHGACQEEEAIVLMLPIIRAIGYLHDQRITHLDIKPDNIMIVENERGVISPTLIDFGLSKYYDRKGKPTSTIRVMATSDGYSPVEQYQGIETFQPTADIYALTATFVYCITGEDPKKSADIRPGEIRQLLQGKVSDSSLSALLNGMKPSQYERTQSVRDLMAELCPDEDSENWDVETDNNITDTIFFRKRKRTTFFISRLKNFFERIRYSINIHSSNEDIYIDEDETKEYIDSVSCIDNQEQNDDNILKEANAAYKSKDYEKAFNLYLKISHIPYAQYCIGFMYRWGQGVVYDDKNNIKNAVIWFERSAKNGNSNGMYEIAKLYENGSFVKRSYGKALHYYKQSALQGNAAALCAIGNMYYIGKGVKQDYHQAAEYFIKSYENCVESQYMLGQIYLQGKGVDINYEEAFKWFKMSSDSGNADGQYKLGRMYEKGIYIMEDIDEAIKYYKMAANRWHPNAKEALRRLGIHDYGGTK